jgi:hypothetical protein
MFSILKLEVRSIKCKRNMHMPWELGISAMFPTNGMTLGRGPGGNGKFCELFGRLNKSRAHNTPTRIMSASKIGRCCGTKV